MPVVLAPGAPDVWDWHVSSSAGDFWFSCDPDVTGTAAQIARPDGWDSPELRTDEEDIPLEWGADVGDVLFGKRILVLNGTIMSPDVRLLEDARRRLLASLRCLTDDGLFAGWDDDGIQRYCRVRRSGKPQLTRVDVGAYTFTAQLTAGDPRKYSIQSTSVQVNPGTHSGSGFAEPFARPFTFSGPLDLSTSPLPNNGDLATPLQISLVGPLDDPLLVEATGTGLRLQLAASIPENRVLVVDGRNRTALLDTTSLLSSFSADSTPLGALQVPARTTTAWRLIAGGAGHALLTADDAWE